MALRIGIIEPDGVPLVNTTGAGITVALIDTGVADVPGLEASNVTIGPDFSFEDQADNLRARDTNGHGTHLAGIIAATDGPLRPTGPGRHPDGIIGIAPGAELLSIKVATADGTVDVTQVIAAINWTIRHKDDYGIRIINLAYGTDGINPYENDPLAYAVERAWQAGIVVVVAAGNDGRGTRELRLPAADPYVIAVGASKVARSGGNGNAHWGTETVLTSITSTSRVREPDVHAPGQSIISLRNPGSASDAINEAGRIGDDLVKATGTSQAAAVVSGAVALLLEARPELTPDQVKELIKSTATHNGVIDIAAAMNAPTPAAVQTWPLSSGTGSLDGTRGSFVVTDGRLTLTGNVDCSETTGPQTGGRPIHG